MCFAWLRNLLCKDLSEEIKKLIDYHKEEIKELNEKLNYYEGGPIPKTSGTISYDSLKELFEGKTKHLFLSDAEYKLVLYDSMKEFLAWDRTDREKWVMTYYDCPVPEETSYALGLFFADGSCGFRNDGAKGGAWWRLTNTNKELLEKAKKGFELVPEDGVYFKINSYKSEQKGCKTNFGKRKRGLNHLEVYTKKGKQERRGAFIGVMRHRFYLNKQKTVPAPIIDSSLASKRAFLEGIIAGDGCISYKTKKDFFNDAGYISVNGKMALAELIKLMRDVRWTYSITKEPNSNTNFRLRFSRSKEGKGKILEYLNGKSHIPMGELIKELGLNRSNCRTCLNELEKEDWIESKRLWKYSKREVKLINKNYNNCDDFSYRLMGQASTPEWAAIAFGIAWSKTHAFNVFVSEDQIPFIIEPQTDKIIKLEEAQGAYSDLQLVLI